jgi:hypothetical protein
VSVKALEKRLAKLEAAKLSAPRRLDLAKLLFPKQHAFVTSTARFKTAVCSRRAGKTVGIAAALVDTATKKPGSVNAYVTSTRLNAKRIVWAILKDFIRDHGIAADISESDLAIQFANGSRIYLLGANTRDEIEKLRGLAIGLAVLDEAQLFPEYIEDLIDQVIVPALMDFKGSLMLTGTPSPIPVGYYFRTSQAQLGWEHHGWTVWDNPWLQKKSGETPEWHLEEEMKRKGVKRDDPVIRREWFGEWVHDEDSLVFRFDKSRNVYDALPPTKTGWQHTIGVDLGFDDSDAIVVLAFADDRPECYLVEEWVAPKQTITQLTDRLAALCRKYEPLGIVVDTGGLGRKIAEEVAARTSLPLKAAEKTRKHEYVELLNDALRSGRMFVRGESKFATDAMLVEWDRDKSTSDRRVVSDRYHSDIADALLYAFRESLHWLHEPAKQAGPQPGSREHAEQVEDEMLAGVQREIERQREEREEMEAWQ